MTTHCFRRSCPTRWVGSPGAVRKSSHRRTPCRPNSCPKIWRRWNRDYRIPVLTAGWPSVCPWPQTGNRRTPCCHQSGGRRWHRVVDAAAAVADDGCGGDGGGGGDDGSPSGEWVPGWSCFGTTDPGRASAAVRGSTTGRRWCGPATRCCCNSPSLGPHVDAPC